MSVSSQKVWLAGVDGCPGGKWIAVFGTPDGETAPARLFENFTDIVHSDKRPSVIAIDIPIGLPEITPSKGRRAEQLARARIGNRRSSVFRIPSRSAVEASVAPMPSDPRERFFHACDIARKTSEDNKAFAKQGFYILDKVDQVDRFMRSEAACLVKVYETHPEVAFWRMNGEIELTNPKKRKSRPFADGLEERETLLLRSGLEKSFVTSPPPIGAGRDDKLDALACLVVAKQIYAGKAICLPDPPDYDKHGLPMAIWA